jgi:tetratricopeptide (TPR) repeat protein
VKGKKTGPASLRKESTPFLEASKHFDEGVQLLYGKNLKKARESFQNVVDNYSEEREMVDRAKMYIKICDGGRSRRDHVLESAEEYFTRATLRFNEGDLDGAIQDHQEALHISPKADYVYFSLAGIYAIKGDADQAVKILEKAIKLNPENRKLAFQDDDFGDLLDNPDFMALVQSDAHN